MDKSSQSTQQFVDIQDIKNGIVTLKSGAMRRVLMVSGINFELKSEEEKNITLATYQNFLNSLDFSLQILIHSRKLNIKGYLAKLNDKKEEENNELIKEQISEYVQFVKSFVDANEIMSKTFFVIVPYDSISLGSSTNKLFSGIPFLGGSKKSQREEDKSTEEKVIQLDQRTEQVISGLGTIGLRAVPLNDEELIELFFNLYNPKPIEQEELAIAKAED